MVIRRGNFFRNSFVESHWELVKECIFDFCVDKKGKKYFGNWGELDVVLFKII